MKFLEKLIYNLNWWPAKKIFSFFFHFTKTSQEALPNLRGPLIIVSNHISWFDPFFIGTAFPFNSKIFPIKYAIINKLYYPLYILIKPFGAFPVKRGVALAESLRMGVKVLLLNGSVGIFPEGGIQPIGKIGRGKRGAAFLAITTGAPILPVKIEANKKITPLNLFLRRCRINIKIGKLFYLPRQEIKNAEELNQYADLIMEKIKNL